MNALRAPVEHMVTIIEFRTLCVYLQAALGLLLTATTAAKTPQVNYVPCLTKTAIISIRYILPLVVHVYCSFIV